MKSKIKMDRTGIDLRKQIVFTCEDNGRCIGICGTIIKIDDPYIYIKSVRGNVECINSRFNGTICEFSEFNVFVFHGDYFYTGDSCLITTDDKEKIRAKFWLTDNCNRPSFVCGMQTFIIPESEIKSIERIVAQK